MIAKLLIVDVINMYIINTKYFIVIYYCIFILIFIIKLMWRTIHVITIIEFVMLKCDKNKFLCDNFSIYNTFNSHSSRMRN